MDPEPVKPRSFVRRIQQFLYYATGGFAVAGLAALAVGMAAPGAPIAPLLRSLGLAVHCAFALEVLLRLLGSRPPWAYLRRHWTDLWFFAPLILFAQGLADGALGVTVRVLVLVQMLVSRTRRAQQFNTLLTVQPAQTLIVGFALTILAGAILLMLPAASPDGRPHTWINALFTATSATCVTGLAVLDTATQFSQFGQLVILTLIQIGGLGIMTLSVTLAILLGRSLDVRQQVALRGAMDYEGLGGMRRMIALILAMTMLFEAAGAACLTFAWRPRFESFSLAAYHATFHSISAFCNAGFSTFSDSLMGFKADAFTQAVICLLIVCGGLGFFVILDLSATASAGLFGGPRRDIPLRIQTRIVLAVSFLLIASGAAMIYALESGRSLAALPPAERALAAVFQSVTARTAGFNTCDIQALSNASAFVLITLMFIGASPGSTGGGIKTTTAAVLWATVISTLRGRAHVELYKRTIPVETIRKAASMLCLSLFILSLFAAALTTLESGSFLDLGFEVVSAFGTVGLSRNLTPTLTDPGRIMITALMFIGRVGPLTLAYALTTRRQRAKYEYAEERVMIG